MATVFPIKVRGLNVVLVVFSLLVLGGSAYAMSTSTSFKSGASNVVQSINGTLIGSKDRRFSSCFNPKSRPTTNYAVIGDVQMNAAIVGGSNIKKADVVTSAACTPLVVSASLADPLLGQNVIATGVSKGVIFYATALKVTGTTKPVQTPDLRQTPRPVPTKR